MPAPGAILLLGGTGKVAGRIAPLLQKDSHEVIQASRSGKSAPGCKGCEFDWLDRATFNKPFENATVASVFLVAPAIMDMLPPMKTFIDLAREKGVKRFVLLSASSLEAGGPAMGQVHQYLLDLKVEYAVLRPTWFMGEWFCGISMVDTYVWQEKFSDPSYLEGIKSDGKIFSATGDGKIPWIAADDIAAIACRALVDEQSHNTDHIILGPELLSYADVRSSSDDIETTY